MPCERQTCLHCGQPLAPRNTWYGTTSVQPLAGPRCVAGQRSRGRNPACPHPTAARLQAWLQPYTQLAFTVLAPLSDGEKAIVAALKTAWPAAPHQRCQLDVLNAIAKPAIAVDAPLRQRLREEVGALAPVPQSDTPPTIPPPEPTSPPPLSLKRVMPS